MRGRDPDTWSVHEYGCHLRDVLLVQRERVLLARRAEAPDVVAMGRDERVEHDGYESQLTPDVARQLDDAASLFAHVLSLIEGDTWERTMIYSYPERMERSLRWVAVHTLHEARHHSATSRRSFAKCLAGRAAPGTSVPGARTRTGRRFGSA